MKTTGLIVALFAAFGAAQAAKDEHPIEKVISMLQGLSAKAESEGKEEALAYEKYEYFVKNSVKELNAAIKQENTDIEELTDLINSKEKAKEVLTGQIADLTQELQDLDSEMKTASSNRGDEADIYDEKKEALELTIDGCQQCLTILEGSKDNTDTGLLQKKVAALVPLLSSKASAKELSLLQEVAVRPTQKAAGDRTAHEKGYAFKSGSVVELLKGLESKFQDELLETEKAETNSLNAFALANAARQDLIDAASASKTARTKELGQTEEDLAEAKGTKEDTEEDLAADTATLEATDKAANLKASEWAERSKTRSNELEAIKVAIGILAKVSGVRTEAPSNPVPPASPIALMQLRAEPSSDKMKAVELLRKTAKVAHSKALEQLATQVAAHLTGPFDKVNNEIEKMIFHLMDEQKKEDEHKLWCDQELEKSNTSLVDKEDKYEELSTKIQNGVSKSAELVQAIADAQTMVADITAHVEESTEIRKVGKEENRLAIKDSEDAQTAVSNAIAVLETHYKDSGAIAKESWEFIQTKGPVELPDEPSTWDSGYTEVADPKAQPGGIVSVLEKVNEDFAEMEAQTRSQEQSDQDAYDEEMKELDIEKARRSKEAEMKTQEQKRTDTKVEEQKKAKKGVSKEIDAVKQYLKDLEPACVSGDSSYSDRKAARDTEIQGLKDAQGILKAAFGKQPGTGFLQKRA
jgi:hypothetical protein